MNERQIMAKKKKVRTNNSIRWHWTDQGGSQQRTPTLGELECRSGTPAVIDRATMLIHERFLMEDSIVVAEVGEPTSLPLSTGSRSCQGR